MRSNKLKRLRELHSKVIHYPFDCSDKEYFLEGKEVGGIKSDILLEQVCPKCFPLLQDKMKVTKSVTKGPVVTLVVKAEIWNKVKNRPSKIVDIQAIKKAYLREKAK